MFFTPRTRLTDLVKIPAVLLPVTATPIVSLEPVPILGVNEIRVQLACPDQSVRFAKLKIIKVGLPMFG